MQTLNEITADDLVITKEGKNVMSGGYKIDNLFLQNNISPFKTDNSVIKKVVMLALCFPI